ncbi:hypothetical protein JZ751_004960 [Albula glossodonta]|uniref:Uncharacterized protein n=1 Tax=Albula glossodonta TaxID=121402 RepID=A0A8T2P1W3_9TELE|nr:hypothetical protein JZ751_004960 [Albula glossodonta]
MFDWLNKYFQPDPYRAEPETYVVPIPEEEEYETDDSRKRRRKSGNFRPRIEFCFAGVTAPPARRSAQILGIVVECEVKRTQLRRSFFPWNLILQDLCQIVQLLWACLEQRVVAVLGSSVKVGCAVWGNGRALQCWMEELVHGPVHVQPRHHIQHQTDQPPPTPT